MPPIALRSESIEARRSISCARDRLLSFSWLDVLARRDMPWLSHRMSQSGITGRLRSTDLLDVEYHMPTPQSVTEFAASGRLMVAAESRTTACTSVRDSGYSVFNVFLVRYDSIGH